MRFVSCAACALIAMAACGGSAYENSAHEKAGKSTNSMAMLAVPLSNAQALQVMIADAQKAIHRALGPTPDLATLKANSGKLALLSRASSRWFPAGTGPDVGKTRAKAEIWQNAEDFAAKLRNFQAAVQAFDAAARGNDVAAITARFADLNGTCKACHDKYRAEEQH